MSVANFTTKEPSSFLNNLRSQTSESHKNLEAIPLSKLLVDPSISLAAYSLYLNLMHDVVADFEKYIYPHVSTVVPDIMSRKKAYLIEDDLKILGVEKTDALPFFKDSDVNFTLPFAMGMLYVLEGSTLGGRFILKNIQENLGLTEEKGISYFSGYGNKTGSQWKNFLNYLTELETATQCEKEIIAGADYAFTIIGNYLSENSSL